MPKAKDDTSTLSYTISNEDEKRLRAAGFAPVVRWVDVKNRSDVGLKTIEALTLVSRRQAEGKGKK